MTVDLSFIPSPSVSEWQFGPLTLRAYALSIIAGIVAAVWITEARLRSRGAPKWATLDVAVWAVPFGIIGARLYHVFTSPQAYFGADGDPVQILMIWEGGLGVPGGIALGGVGAWIGCRQIGLPMPMLADALAPGLPVAQAIGRLGNWFNQELYGKPTEVWWALSIDPGNREPGYYQYATFHPTFLYEALWNLGVAVLIWAADRRFKFGAGRAFALYVGLYGVGRFWVEGLRIDDAATWLDLRLNQWMSIVIVLGAIVYLLITWNKQRSVLIPVGDRVEMVTWDSERAEHAGYVNGRLPRSVEATNADTTAEADDDDVDDDGSEPKRATEPDEPEVDSMKDNGEKPNDSVKSDKNED
ncbi:prolipoprotein diacylglyceryl transferase [Haloglycomyces albus]|uniref:prolipoprotein diacylglyceryl transferase n=1 Tax=Haloglycomyces albus TaxID=526067 RepID=UPI001FE067C0|nr:prolipoprotein diacylglyceryl transferase [Haloglycomyces albus]